MPIFQCIYCGVDVVVDTKYTGDHILPSACFGEFRDAFNFKRICVKCNNEIGHIEEELVRCSPEAIFSNVILQNKKQLRKRLPSKGTPAQYFISYSDELGVNLKVNPTDLFNQNAEIKDQIIFKDKNGNEKYIELHPKLNIDKLKKKLFEQGYCDSEIYLNSSEQNTNIYLDLLQTIFPDRRFEEKKTMEKGVHTVKGQIINFTTERTRRSIAKTIFHYYLTYSNLYKGDEKSFEPIRDYIKNGLIDNTTFFQIDHKYFVDLMPDNCVPGQTCHVLAAIHHDNIISGFVRYFWGPKRDKIDHYIKIANTAIVLPPFAMAHTFIYDDSPHGNKIGEIKELPLVRLR